MANRWSESEVEAVVEDYFRMLRLELEGKRYNKAARSRVLREKLRNRSHGSVEFKHQNISAVLIEMGVPYIDGYKPRFNYQKLLVSAVADYLDTNPELQQLLAVDVEVVPAVPSVEDILKIWEEAPAPDGGKKPVVADTPNIYNPVGINYLEREARNQKLGEAGEQLVINYERARLIHAGKGSLAERIEQVSVTEGPSAGFDIRSYETNGADRFIETKTTKYGKNTPFFITPNELRFARNNESRYHLYRLFKFGEKPGLFTLHGSIEAQCVLEPTVFMARVM